MEEIGKYNSPANNGVPEDTYFLAHDTITYDVSTVLDDVKMFGTINKPKQYQSHDFATLASTKDVYITAIQLNTNMLFTARTSEPAGETFRYFLNFSYIHMDKFEKNYDPLPLATLMPFDLVNLTTTFSYLGHTSNLFELPEPIKIPQGNSLNLEFRPAKGLTTAGTGATNPQLSGWKTEAFYLRVFLLGTQKRPSA